MKRFILSLALPLLAAATVCTVDLEGESPLASNFDASTALDTLSATPTHVCDNDGSVRPNNQPCSAAPDLVGAFRFICTAGQVLPDDPIVFPGQPGKSHLHQFYGNTGANAYSTYASLRMGGGSTCNRFGDLTQAANRSAYWMPAMLDLLGQVVKPYAVAIYYKRRPASDPKCGGLGSVPGAEGKCVAVPNGLKFIFGFDMLTGKSPTGELWFNCQGPGARPGHYNSLAEVAPNCPIGAQLGAIITAPSCWNGKDIDSANHRDHVAYKQRNQNTGQVACDAAHPYVIPAFTLGAWYQVVSDPSKWSLSSDAMFPNLAKGTTFHADYFEAWDPSVKAMWTDNCINRMLNCSAGNLGNGKRLKGAMV